MTAPAGGQEPGLGWCDGVAPRPRSRRDVLEAVEARRRRAPIERGQQRRPPSRCVTALLKKNVRERAPNLARRSERDRVIALAEDLPFAAEQVVEPHRDADGEPSRTSAQGALVPGFDDQVQVIWLDGVPDESKPRALFSSGEGGADDLDALLGAEAGHRRRHARSDAGADARRPSVEPWGAPALGPDRLAAGSLFRSAPGAEDEAGLARGILIQQIYHRLGEFRQGFSGLKKRRSRHSRSGARAAEPAGPGDNEENSRSGRGTEAERSARASSLR